MNYEIPNVYFSCPSGWAPAQFLIWSAIVHVHSSKRKRTINHNASLKTSSGAVPETALIRHCSLQLQGEHHHSHNNKSSCNSDSNTICGQQNCSIDILINNLRYDAMTCKLILLILWIELKGLFLKVHLPNDYQAINI